MAKRSCKARWLLSTVAVLVICGAACPFFEAQAQSRGPFTASGVVEPTDGLLSIGTAATGVVASIAGRPGERVHHGQELIRIDCAPLEARVKSLAAQSLAAQAAADRVRHGPRQEEITVGEANVGVARARAEEAADALHRARALQVGVSVTQAVVLQIQRDARISGAQLDDARARLDLLRSGSRAEDIAEADAKRDAATATLDEARAEFAQCSVSSPIDGVVVARFASRDQFVSAAVPMVLLQIEDDSDFSVRAEVDEGRLADLCPGQRASIVPSDGSRATLPAGVARIAPLANAPDSPMRPSGSPPGQIAVTVKPDQRNSGLVAGEKVTVRFEACHS